jgi:hypothetical protein
MKFQSLNEFPRVFKPKYVFWKLKGMNSNRPPHAGSAQRRIWPGRPMPAGVAPLVQRGGHHTSTIRGGTTVVGSSAMGPR